MSEILILTTARCNAYAIGTTVVQVAMMAAEAGRLEVCHHRPNPTPKAIASRLIPSIPSASIVAASACFSTIPQTPMSTCATIPSYTAQDEKGRIATVMANPVNSTSITGVRPSIRVRRARHRRRVASTHPFTISASDRDVTQSREYSGLRAYLAVKVAAIDAANIGRGKVLLNISTSVSW